LLYKFKTLKAFKASYVCIQRQIKEWKWWKRVLGFKELDPMEHPVALVVLEPEGSPLLQLLSSRTIARALLWAASLAPRPGPTPACCMQEQQVVHQADSTNGQLPLEVGEAGGLLQALASALVLGRAVGQNLQKLVAAVRKPASSSEGRTFLIIIILIINHNNHAHHDHHQHHHQNHHQFDCHHHCNIHHIIIIMIILSSSSTSS
jgi:hypothetical protein